MRLSISDKYVPTYLFVMHRFQVNLWLTIDHIFASDRGCFILTHSLANIRINFTYPETKMIVLPDTEDRTIVIARSIIPLDKTPERDGRTARQTDGQTAHGHGLQRSALRAMRTRCKTTDRKFMKTSSKTDIIG